MGETLDIGLATRQLFEEKRPLTPLAPRPVGHWPSGASAELGRDEENPGPSPQSCHVWGAWAQLSPREQDPPSSQGWPLPAHLLSFCSLPAVSIPVVHLHLDGPVRQRARGGMDFTQHLRGLRMGPYSCSWAKTGYRNTQQAPRARGGETQETKEQFCSPKTA